MIQQPARSLDQMADLRDQVLGFVNALQGAAVGASKMLHILAMVV
jgi:hypothetical protein